MSEWPNNDHHFKNGDYVRNVHPCGHFEEGVVVWLAPDHPNAAWVKVATGRSSTSFGPAENWMLMDRKPSWLIRLQAEESGAFGV